MPRRPEDVWPVDPEYSALYESRVLVGRQIAAEVDCCLVGIARNCGQHLANTLALVDEVVTAFRDFKAFVYENDSGDGTKAILTAWRAERPWVTVRSEDIGVEDTRGFERSRTERLARARNICFEFVKHSASRTTYTIVLDLDPEHGFSVDGVFNSIAWLSDKTSSPSPLEAGGMAAFSLYYEHVEGGNPRVAHYDSWAHRPVSWWRDRRDEIGMGWSSMLLFPVGAPPMPVNSAFGGLGVYYTRAYLAGGYSGEDCEHVPHHKRMHEAGYQMWLNPGCRYISIWR